MSISAKLLISHTNVNYLGIDTYTKGKRSLISKLRNLKTTKEVQDGGCYYQDLSLSQIWIDTTWTEEELENWLYNSKDVDYIGVFIRDNPIYDSEE